MQFEPLDKAARADWRSMLAKADRTQLLVAAVLFLFSALTLSLPSVTAVSVLYLGTAVIFYYMLTHSLAAILTVAFPGVLLFGLSGTEAPFALPAAYAAILLGSVLGAFLLVHCRTPRQYLPLLALLVLAFAITALITRNPLQGLLALIPVLLAIALARGVLDCRPLTQSVLTVTVVTAVIAVGAWLIMLAATDGFVGNPLLALVETVRTGIVSTYEEVISLYQEQGIVLGISDTDLHNIAAMLGNILPGAFLAVCLVFSFGMWRMLLRVLTGFGTLPRIPVRLATLSVSSFAAALFVLAYIISLIANSGSTTLLGTACENLTIALEAPLVLIGFSSLVGPRREARSCLSLILAVALVVLFVSYPSAGIALAAFVGAFHILLARFLPTNQDKGES